MKHFILGIFTILLLMPKSSRGQNTENVFLITLDGLRWQELFGGAVDSMMLNDELTEDKSVIEKFSAVSKKEARKKLMPWFWKVAATEGQIYGNRWKGSKVNCTNRFWFSYPGYNEILTGYSDPNVNSNAKKYNTNKTILEQINNTDEFNGKVAAFCSWDVFPYIINDRRSGIYVNAGFDQAKHSDLTPREIFLNTLQTQIPSPWTTVRLDAFTHHFMMEYVNVFKPRMVYISYGETDDFAHDGRYDHYLNSAHQTDQFINDLWNYVQADPTYKDKTTFIITTDHGRGHSPMEHWKSHGTIYKGSDQIWIAAIGPDTKPLGEVGTDQQLTQSQVAATVMELLGLQMEKGLYEYGSSIKSILE